MVEPSFPVKRTHPRFSFFAKVEVILEDRTSVSAQLSELSSHGCYIQALEPIPIGTGLLLRISDGRTTCEVQGEVIYMHSANGMGIFGIGVRFEEMAPEQRSSINNWLCERADRSG
jgi:PilZ domain